jgi:adenine-specific DNA-methyltransferase
VIKYIGSKRRLVPALGAVAGIVGGRTALDLFTGTTRVAQELRRRGYVVTAVDTARYAEMFARTYIALSNRRARSEELQRAVRALNTLAGAPGYVAEMFCRQARFFQEHNGERIDAIRAAIARDHAGSWIEAPLLTALIEAADRVDSTTGVQMAYLKTWAPRASNALELRVPDVPEGPAGRAVRADAVDAAARLGRFDLAYLDPPYNQHRYFTNYHVWETLVAWDHPDTYGLVRKRVDAKHDSTRSVFNDRRRMPAALAACIARVDAAVVVVSYNDESWVSLEELVAMCARRGRVEVLAFDSKRYVGAQIGIHDPNGTKVGQVGRLRNVEYLVVAGDLDGRQRRALRAIAPGRITPVTT